MRRLFILALLIVAACHPRDVHAQASLLPYVEGTFTDANANPLSSGFICTTLSGTTTNAATYPTAADAAAGTNQNTNPIVLDSAGRSNIFVNSGLYRIVILNPVGTGSSSCNGTPTGSAIKTVDGVIGGTGGSGAANLNCSIYPGANAGAKIAACITALPSTGGIADARGFAGAQTISQDIRSGNYTKQVTLLLGTGVSFASSAQIVTANLGIEGPDTDQVGWPVFTFTVTTTGFLLGDGVSDVSDRSFLRNITINVNGAPNNFSAIQSTYGVSGKQIENILIKSTGAAKTRAQANTANWTGIKLRRNALAGLYHLIIKNIEINNVFTGFDAFDLVIGANNTSNIEIDKMLINDCYREFQWNGTTDSARNVYLYVPADLSTATGDFSLRSVVQGGVFQNLWLDNGASVTRTVLAEYRTAFYGGNVQGNDIQEIDASANSVTDMLGTGSTLAYNTGGVSAQDINARDVKPNLVGNAYFDTWLNGTSFTDAASGTVTARGWTALRTGADNYTITKTTGAGCCQYSGQSAVISVTTAALSTDFNGIEQDIEALSGFSHNAYQARPVSFAAYVKGTGTFQMNITGAGAPQTCTLTATFTTCMFQGVALGGGADITVGMKGTGSVNIDSVMMVPGTYFATNLRPNKINTFSELGKLGIVHAGISGATVDIYAGSGNYNVIQSAGTPSLPAVIQTTGKPVIVTMSTSNPTPTIPQTYSFDFVAVDGQVAPLIQEGFGVSGTFWARRANGTANAPSAISAQNSLLATFGGGGYGATTYSSGPRGAFIVESTQAWTDTAQGAMVVFNTTTSGGTASFPRVSIMDGLVVTSIADTSALDPGIGGLYASGAIVLTGLASASTGDYLCFNTSTTRVSQGTAPCTSSSERFKHDITYNATPGLDLVSQMRPIRFVRNDHPEIGEQYGFKAEDVFSLDSRLVNVDREGKPEGFLYMNYAAVLTKALQELNDRVKALENK